jgi:hypothetical protein
MAYLTGVQTGNACGRKATPSRRATAFHLAASKGQVDKLCQLVVGAGTAAQLAQQIDAGDHQMYHIYPTPSILDVCSGLCGAIGTLRFTWRAALATSSAAECCRGLEQTPSCAMPRGSQAGRSRHRWATLRCLRCDDSGESCTFSL